MFIIIMNLNIHSTAYICGFLWKLAIVLPQNLDRWIGWSSPNATFSMDGLVKLQLLHREIIWLVVWNFFFPIQLGISSSQLMNSIIFQRGRAQPPTSRVKSIELPRCFVIKLQHKHENAHKCQESAEAMKIHGGWCFLVVSWGPKLQSNDMWLYYAWTIKWLGIYMAISIFLYIYHDLYWLIMIMLLEMILRLYWKKITNWG